MTELLRRDRAECLATIEDESSHLNIPSEIILFAEQDRPDAILHLACGAWEITAEAVNFMAAAGRGLICLALREDQAGRLRISYMTAHPTNPRCAAFGRSVEATIGVSTGISAADRALTMRIAANPKAKPPDLVSPGHVFPVIVSDSEPAAAALALAYSGGKAAAAYCTVLRSNGDVARVADLHELNWAQSLTLRFVATMT